MVSEAYQRCSVSDVEYSAGRRRGMRFVGCSTTFASMTLLTTPFCVSLARCRCLGAAAGGLSADWPAALDDRRTGEPQVYCLLHRLAHLLPSPFTNLRFISQLRLSRGACGTTAACWRSDTMGFADTSGLGVEGQGVVDGLLRRFGTGGLSHVKVRPSARRKVAVMRWCPSRMRRRVSPLAVSPVGEDAGESPGRAGRR